MFVIYRRIRIARAVRIHTVVLFEWLFMQFKLALSQCFARGDRMRIGWVKDGPAEVFKFA